MKQAPDGFEGVVLVHDAARPLVEVPLIDAVAEAGVNVSGGLSYDILNGMQQNQFVQVSYNGGCCGLGVEYRRIELGTVRTENQFRFSFIVANIGTFGNLRRQERIY